MIQAASDMYQPELMPHPDIVFEPSDETIAAHDSLCEIEAVMELMRKATVNNSKNINDLYFR